MKNELYEIEIERRGGKNVIAFARSAWGSDGVIVSVSRQRYICNTQERADRIFRVVHRSGFVSDFSHLEPKILSVKLKVPCK